MKVYYFSVVILLVLLACTKVEVENKPYNVYEKDSTDIHFEKDK